MKIEDVAPAMEQRKIVTHRYKGEDYHYIISGCITRFSPVIGWYYLAELSPPKGECRGVVVAALEDVT